MKRLFVILQALICFAISTQAQTQVSTFNPAVTAEGVTYALPKTMLKVRAEGIKTTFTPGEFAPYAERYLHLGNAGTKTQTRYEFTSLQVSPEGIPDTTKLYTIRLKGRTIAPLVELDERGILLSINHSEPTKAQLQQNSANIQTHNALDSRKFLTEEILTATSSAKMAELTAAEIYEIRESRNSIMRGQVESMPKDGESFRIVINQLNEQEAALLQLFTGYTDTVSIHNDYTYAVGEDVSGEVLFRFSNHFGFVDADDLSGDPIKLSAKNLHAVPLPTEAEKAKRKLDGVVYNMPGAAQVAITFNQQTLFDKELPIAQLGTTDILPAALFNKDATTQVKFDGATGAVLQCVAK